MLRTLRARQFLTHRRQEMFEIAVSRRLGTQVLNSIPALGDGLLRPGDRAIESLNCVFGSPGKHIASRLKSKKQSVEALQQRVVQLAGDARPFAHSLFQAHIELIRQLPHSEAVKRNYCRKGEQQES